MSRRDSSSTGHHTKSKSSLPPIKMADVYPLEWTCVKDVNIEKRLDNSFETWKFDVQCQIANMGRRLDTITKEHKLDDMGGFAIRTPQKEEAHKAVERKVAEEYRQKGLNPGGFFRHMDLTEEFLKY